MSRPVKARRSTDDEGQFLLRLVRRRGLMASSARHTPGVRDHRGPPPRGAAPGRTRVARKPLGRSMGRYILSYNLGTGAIRAAATHGLILERSFVPLPAAPHHYRYELTPDTVPWSTWRASERLATIRLTAPASLFAEPKAERWWLAARRGEITAHSNRQDPPDAYAVSITVAPPVHWRGNLSNLIKPLADGLVSALHSHMAPSTTCSSAPPQSTRPSPLRSA
jgi:hypothetical protein